MSVDLVALASEINNDPKAMGFAALKTAGNDQGIANLLNALTGPGAASINVTSMAKDAFVEAVAASFFGLWNLSATLQAKYDRALQILNGFSLTVNPNGTNLGNLLAAMVADSVMAPATKTAIQTRTGSRAEVLFGQGVIISSRDVAAALGRSA